MDCQCCKDSRRQIEANMLKCKGFDRWLVKSSLMQKSLTIPNCLSRYEAISVVKSFEVKTGSKSESQVDASKHAITNRLLKEKELDNSISVSYIAK